MIVGKADDHNLVGQIWSNEFEMTQDTTSELPYIAMILGAFPLLLALVFSLFQQWFSHFYVEATNPMKGSIQSKPFPIFMLLKHVRANRSRIHGENNNLLTFDLLLHTRRASWTYINFKLSTTSDAAGNSRHLAGFPGILDVYIIIL